MKENVEKAEVVLPHPTEDLKRELSELTEKFDTFQSNVLALKSRQTALDEISSALNNDRVQDLLVRQEGYKLAADSEKSSAELWRSNNNELNVITIRTRELEEKVTHVDKRCGNLEILLEEVTFC